MKKFLLNGFLCVVGINLMSLSILLNQLGWRISSVLFLLAFLFAIVTFIAALYYWKDWNEE